MIERVRGIKKKKKHNDTRETEREKDIQIETQKDLVSNRETYNLTHIQINKHKYRIIKINRWRFIEKYKKRNKERRIRSMYREKQSQTDSRYRETQ